MNKLIKDQQGVVGPVEILMIAVIVGLVGFIGWRVYDARTDVSNSAVNPGEVVKIEPLPNDLSGIIDVDRLKTIVDEQAPGLTIVDLELKNEDGVLVYEAKLSDGSVIVINATDGTYVTKIEDDENDDEEVPGIQSLKIDFAAALKTALEQHDGQVRKIELEVEDGVVVYSVRFTDGFRVDINAENGGVTRTKNSKNDSNKSEDSDSNDDADKNDDEFEDDGQDDKRGSRQSNDSEDDSDEDQQDSNDDNDDEEENEDNDKNSQDQQDNENDNENDN